MLVTYRIYFTPPLTPLTICLLNAIQYARKASIFLIIIIIIIISPLGSVALD